MDATRSFHSLLQRFEVFCRDVIDPAVHPATHPLDVSAWQCVEPVPFAQVEGMTFAPVCPGWEWGPVWSTCWFRIRGRVPGSMAGRTVALRFSTDTEALLWRPTPGTPSRGTPVHGLDVNRDTVRLLEPARGGEAIDLYVEAACNHLFGDRGLQWDPPEVHRRWNSPTPGRLDRCELAVVDETVWRLKWVYTFALQLARELPADSARARQLYGALQHCTSAIPDDDVAAAAPAALADLESAVRAPAGGSATLCHAVGHAHIDTAWLWPVRETRRKCLRTFSTVLRNMERFPEYVFLCSQAQQYAWLEEASPELFAEVRQQVAAGRWEAGGAMWVEPDCTAPSGESLIRQIIHADRYWREKFGDQQGRQRFLYLPDTFGFPGQIPQIMRLAGLDTFITNKLHWNDTNEFPHTTFIWRGIDGSEVVAHNTPGTDYNALLTPRELLRGERTHRNKEVVPGPARWLQPFGFGDGGGGPTDWNILNARLASDCDSVPRVRFSTVSAFCEALHRDIADAREHHPWSVPVHRGELYLELHRGTFTTHARIKQANAECEELLRQAEILAFAGPQRLPRDQERQAASDLDRAWKRLLLNQFHDILPGSSIGWVYDDARKDYDAIGAVAQPLIESGARRWAARIRSGAMGAALSLGPRGCDCRIAVCEPTAAAGTPIGFDEPSLTVTHGPCVARFDTAGRIVSLCSGTSGEIRGPAPLNQLVLYEDRPKLWDAWDIDPDYVTKPSVVDGPAALESTRNADGSLELRFLRQLGRNSRIEQRFRFHPSCPGVIEVGTVVDWHEAHRLLRVLFPTSVTAPTFRAGTQFGFLDRPTALADRAGGAMFECPFQGWLSLGDPAALGLTLVFPDRYGASCDGGTLGVSLLRSPKYPDPSADMGEHRFRYLILAQASEAFPFALSPLLWPARPVETTQAADSGPDAWAPIQTDLRLESAALDPAGRLLVRLSNPRNSAHSAAVRWGFPVRRVEPVTVLGEPVQIDQFAHPAQDASDSGPATVFRIGPLQVVTLAVERAD